MMQKCETGRRFLLMKVFMRGAAAAAFAAAVLCSSAFAAADSVELKLQVKKDLFAISREAVYKALQTVLSETAQKLAMKYDDEDDVDEDTVVVRYYDTADKALAAKNFVVREKFKAKKGTISDTGTLMLKLRRGAELSAEELTAFQNGLAHGAEYKYEADVLGLVDGRTGNISTSYSASAKLKKQPDFSGKTVGDLAALYPVLNAAGADPKAVLNSTPDVLSYEAEVGEVKFGEGKAEIETAVWYDASGKNLRLVELSWKYRPGRGDEQNRALFQALQERTDVFDAGKLKSAN